MENYKKRKVAICCELALSLQKSSLPLKLNSDCTTYWRSLKLVRFCFPGHFVAFISFILAQVLSPSGVLVDMTCTNWSVTFRKQMKMQEAASK